ncbi:hypothetical protein TIFTF001_012642 [Ficus carica]|uniref:Uncharacterized protein n=1 Tax=Ficus carica TaxID=3494 RepID=A0AA88AGB3_FICCA|nr:hypothetical protein TIFTF001_012642 [Ficus carica]
MSLKRKRPLINRIRAVRRWHGEIHRDGSSSMVLFSDKVARLILPIVLIFRVREFTILRSSSWSRYGWQSVA